MSGQNQQAELQRKVKEAQSARDEAKSAVEKATSDSVPVRRERVFHLVESQQLRTQIEVCMQKIKELRLQITAKEREAEEIEDQTRTEIQVYKQKVKHLMHTHRKDLDSINEDKNSTLEQQKNEHLDYLKRLETDAQRLNGEFTTLQGHHAMQQKQLKEEYDRFSQHIKDQYLQNLKDIQEENQKNIESLHEDYELQRINEIHEIQERKDYHIRGLMENHDAKFREMKDFYNKITQDHLSQISQYESELENIDNRYAEYEQRKKNYEKEIYELNKKLQEKKRENNLLHKALSTYETDKMSLANSRARIQSLEMEIESLKRRRKTKEEKFKNMEKERDMLIEKFEATIHDVKQKTEFRALLLQKRVEVLDDVLQKKESQLDEMLEKADLPEEQIEDISNRVDDLLQAKNNVIENLEFELAKATKAHNDLIAIYQAKMSSAGVPLDEIMFEPLPSNTTTAPAPSLFK
ncbi:growth arrest-specific protein 8-like [Histomonas meleagridis]|uniref:growth arrest-specific protein 8-like n=1 Tax=Histomonas meleagridis TaxID=135588 RepID=UPI003559C63C|nr:growth arrest-specific protein 8-like [Histomonas meleagridis]KAH0802833.1 growth arrest-specific protein 8-like [Histomonas meleagridis]